MNNIVEATFRLCVVAVLIGNILANVDQPADDKSRDNADNNREWRLGRGLQMLRLGKRSANLESGRFGRRIRSVDGQDSPRLSTSEIQAVLDSIFSEPRDESRRQPPLPRYGRDSSINRFLVDDNTEDGYSFEIIPSSNTRSFFRPAPRGGRYKKAFPMGRFAYGDYFSQAGDNHARSLVFPRIGHIIDQLAILQPTAVPRPRYGRTQNDDSDDSVQN